MITESPSTGPCLQNLMTSSWRGKKLSPFSVHSSSANLSKLLFALPSKTWQNHYLSPQTCLKSCSGGWHKHTILNRVRRHRTQIVLTQQHPELDRLCWGHAFLLNQVGWIDHDCSISPFHNCISGHIFDFLVQQNLRSTLSLCQKALWRENSLSVFRKQGARKWANSTIASNNAMTVRVGQSSLDINSAPKCLAYQWPFLCRMQKNPIKATALHCTR